MCILYVYLVLIVFFFVVAGELHGATLWLVVCGAAALVAAALGALACWIARRRNSLAHKLGTYIHI